MKKIILMHGLPGSGKSHRARQVAQSRCGVIVSADHFFTFENHGDPMNTSPTFYHWDEGLAPIAQKYCRDRCNLLVERATPTIIVDDCCLRLISIRGHLQAASDHGYLVELMEPETPWQDNPYECAKRNIHFVPVGTICDWHRGRDSLNLIKSEIARCNMAPVPLAS